ncbi:hypothetical protein C8R41DRAFT_852091 [Lentinula lateritia]|uniref:Uncharacterized protein n=1 Tax=Lentinula lateritia TaxID=40482 RepID=A0ABQ8V244_9AGAR|nr:hypothetical protein C8R41DRAFT_852091 [Lentinula lateritia]
MLPREPLIEFNGLVSDRWPAARRLKRMQWLRPSYFHSERHQIASKSCHASTSSLCSRLF